MSVAIANNFDNSGHSSGNAGHISSLRTGTSSLPENAELCPIIDGFLCSLVVIDEVITIDKP